MMKTWKYYKHAMIPTTAPHKKADEEALKNKQFWKENKNALLARWTTDWDCGHETNWWYVIKDDSFDLSSIKSGYRYKINKGVKNFDVRVIDPREYVENLYEVFVEAFESWPAKYRPKFTHDDAERLTKNLSADSEMVCYGAFYRETDELCGFMQVPTHEAYAELQVQRVKPTYEKLQINAALVYGLLENNKDKLQKANYYILDGARSISHETNFQDYLEKYFGFRKAYCNLHIAYNPRIKWIVKLLFPFRNILHKFDEIGFIHQINSVLYMEELSRR